MNDDLNPLESERLRRLLDAAELPREVTPPEGAWPAIRQRIEAGRVRAIAPGTDAPANRRTFRWWPIAAAATVTLALGLAVVLRTRGKATPPALAGAVEAPGPLSAPIGSPAIQEPVRAVTTIPVARAAANPALAAVIDQYHAAARELEASVSVRMAALPPETREVVRRSLAAIDSAIADLRTALGHDPANAAVGQYLTAMYDQKLDFLKRVRAMPGAGM